MSCLKYLQKLNTSELECLRGNLTNACLLSLEEYYETGSLEGSRKVSVPWEKIYSYFKGDGDHILRNYVFEQEYKEEGYIPFLRPLGFILESVLPRDLSVSDKRGYHWECEDFFIDFEVYQRDLNI